MNRVAANYDKFDEYIRRCLGFAAGRDAMLGSKLNTPSDFLAEGGAREDDGGALAGRFYNHFHNPLKPWSEAGLTFAGPNSSSVRWMQDPGQGWGWRDARELYRVALTAPDPRTREAATADLFRALGQIMHLVADASVPEHTRNDAHPFGSLVNFLGGRAGNYEYWVSDEQQRLGDAEFTARYLSDPIGFDSSILQLPAPAGESVATVPIARLIDTDRYEYNGLLPPNPNVTLGGAIGLAEFSNANFFSEDTLNGAFPFPRRQGLTPTPQIAPNGSRVRAYLAKPPGQGLPTTVALAECLDDYSVDGEVEIRAPYPCVDEAVWKETARHMLPRAVGYARGVLDYFFRARIFGAHVAYTVEATPRPALVLRNDSGEMMAGSFEVYAGGTGERREALAALYVNLNEDEWYVYGGSTFALAPGELALAVVAPPSSGTRHLIAVFKGQLGQEDGGVASQTIELSN